VASLALAVLVTLAALRAGVWAVQQQEARDATAHLAAVVASTPDGGTVDLASAFPAAWDRAAVVGGYAFGSDVNSLLGVRAMDDELWLTDEQLEALVFLDGDRVVAVVDLWEQPYEVALEDEIDWKPGLAITRDHARFTVRLHDKDFSGPLLVPTVG
jgi:hypothetical protein